MFNFGGAFLSGMQTRQDQDYRQKQLKLSEEMQREAVRLQASRLAEEIRARKVQEQQQDMDTAWQRKTYMDQLIADPDFEAPPDLTGQKQVLPSFGQQSLSTTGRMHPTVFSAMLEKQQTDATREYQQGLIGVQRQQYAGLEANRQAQLQQLTMQNELMQRQMDEQNMVDAFASGAMSYAKVGERKVDLAAPIPSLSEPQGPGGLPPQIAWMTSLLPKDNLPSTKSNKQMFDTYLASYEWLTKRFAGVSPQARAHMAQTGEGRNILNGMISIYQVLSSGRTGLTDRERNQYLEQFENLGLGSFGVSIRNIVEGQNSPTENE